MRPTLRSETIANRTVNILLVEDHNDTRRVLSTLLGRSGHEILTAGTPKTIEDVERTCAESPRLPR